MYYKISIMCVLMFYSLTSCASTDPFNVDIETNLKLQCLTGDNIAIVTITNSHIQPIYLSKTIFRSDGLTFRDAFDIVDVLTNKKINYRGLIGSYSPDGDEFLILNKQKSKSFLFNISKLYALDPARDYKVKYNVSIFNGKVEKVFSYISNEIVADCR